MPAPKDEWKLFPPELRERLLQADPSLAELEPQQEEDWDELVEQETERLRRLNKRRLAREEAKAVLALEEPVGAQQSVILDSPTHSLDARAWLGIFNAVWITSLVLYFLLGE